MLNNIFVNTAELEEKPKKSFFRFPKEKSVIYKIWWVYTWPLKFILRSTIPSPVTCRRYYPLAFLLCIVWIGANSYIVTWSITVIGRSDLIYILNVQLLLFHCTVSSLMILNWDIIDCNFKCYPLKMCTYQILY